MPVKKNPLFDSAAISQLLTKHTDTALLLADNQLNDLLLAHNVNAYVNASQWIIDRIKPNATASLIKKYYQNIFLQKQQVISNPDAMKVVANAYYGWAEISFQREDRTDDSVIICLENAVGLHHKINALPPGDESYAYKMLGICYNQLGDTKKALNYYELESHTLNLNYINGVAGNVINRSIALKETGLIDSAVQLLSNTLVYPGISVIKRADMLTILSELQTMKGLHRNAAVSVDSAVKMLDTFTVVSEELHEKIGQAFKQQALLERLNKNYQAALQTQSLALHHYLAAGNTTGRTIAKVYIELGKDFEAAGKYDSAMNYYQQALQKVIPVKQADDLFVPSPEQLYAENAIMEALDAKANLLQLLFKQTADHSLLPTAIRCYEMSFEVERKLMQNFSYDESRLIMLQQSRSRSEVAIGICYEMLQASHDNKWTERAFLLAEKSKAFVLLESVKRNVAANNILQHDSLYQRIQFLQLRLANVEKELVEAGGNLTDSLRSKLLQQQSALSNELLLANNELIRQHASYKILSDKKDSLSLALVDEKLLDDHTAMMEFFAGDTDSYIISVSKNTAPVFSKIEKEVSKDLDDFLYFFADKNRISNSPAAYQEAAYTLYRQLGFASCAVAGINRLLIIPDGKFGLLPFDALITKISDQPNLKSFAYLLLHYQINCNYSAAAVLKQLETEQPVAGGNIAGFAPVFAHHERAQTPLLSTVEELDIIKRELGSGKYFLQQDAVVSNFKKQLLTADMLHIATHASADTGGAHLPKIEFFDSSFYLNELYAMHFNLRLVVLSACQTGIGEINKSEGALSLARGFYYAGARNIVTSLWSVDDHSTALIFKHFYKHLSGNDYTLALHNAKLAYLSGASAASASPYYWAAFEHTGFEKPADHNFKLTVTVILFLLLLAGVVFYRRRQLKLSTAPFSK